MNHRVMTLAWRPAWPASHPKAPWRGAAPSSGASKGLAQTPGAAAPAGTAPLALPTLLRQTPAPLGRLHRGHRQLRARHQLRSAFARGPHRAATGTAGWQRPRPSRELIAREVLERIIQEKVQLQLAREMNLKVDDYAVNQAEAAVAQQNGLTVSELQRRLVSEGLNRDRFREELRNQLLLQRVREREVDAKGSRERPRH